MGVIFQENLSKGANWGWQLGQFTDAQIVSQTDIARIPGEPALKFSVSPGQRFIAGTTGEYAKLVAMFSPTGNNNEDDHLNCGATEYHGFSLYVPPGFVFPTGQGSNAANQGSWCIPWQLHPPNNAPANSLSPSLELDCGVNPGTWTLLTRGGDTSNVLRAASNVGPVVLGQWTDFLVKVTYGIDTNAETRVFRRDNLTGQLAEACAPINQPNLYSVNGGARKHYFVSGLYRSNTPGITSVMYRSKLIRATSFAEAYQAFLP